MNHECIEKFDKEKINRCLAEGYNKCYGLSPMTLEIWYQDTDGLEEYFDNWMKIEVNYCPYCGLKSKGK